MNRIDLNQKTCWIIVEKGLIGTENQCLAVANALGYPYEIKKILLKQPWKSLSPYLLPDCEGMLAEGDISPPYPNIVIAGGRKSIATARYIKKKSPETFTSFLLSPKIKNHNFDLIAAPAHDNLQGDKIISTIGAANKITPDILKEAKDNTSYDLPIKKITVIIGGNSKTHKMTSQITNNICDTIEKLSKDHGILITASRRTGDENMSILKERISKLDNCYLWDGQGDNPYFSFLAHADYIMVTNDSVSMISDAASTGKPIYILELDGGSPKFERFYKSMKDYGAIRKFEGKLEAWDYAPLNDAQKIADYIKKQLEEKS